MVEKYVVIRGVEKIKDMVNFGYLGHKGEISLEDIPTELEEGRCLFSRSGSLLGKMIAFGHGPFDNIPEIEIIAIPENIEFKIGDSVFTTQSTSPDIINTISFYLNRYNKVKKN